MHNPIPSSIMLSWTVMDPQIGCCPKNGHSTPFLSVLCHYNKLDAECAACTLPLIRPHLFLSHSWPRYSHGWGYFGRHNCPSISCKSKPVVSGRNSTVTMKPSAPAPAEA